MKLAWLEDFLALVDTGTFSAAAVRRNVTQPAFSRRIRMLEQWLGVTLIDRGSHRFAVTSTAARFEPEIRALVGRTYDLRSRMRSNTLAEPRLAITSQHTPMLTHLPEWLRRFQEWQPHTTFQVHAGDVEACMRELVEGRADLMLAYEAEAVEDGTAAQRALTEKRILGTDSLVPVAAVPPGTGETDEHAPLRVLNYPERSFLGRVVRTHCLATLVRQRSVEFVCESAFAVGIKELCLAGLGIAWLPRELVAQELAAERLHSLELRLPCPSLTITARRMRGTSNAALDDIWDQLEPVHAFFL